MITDRSIVYSILLTRVKGAATSSFRLAFTVPRLLIRCLSYSLLMAYLA